MSFWARTVRSNHLQKCYHRFIRVLDLFAGSKGWSDPWLSRGHTVMTLDNDPIYEADITESILEWDAASLKSFKPDVILASPPCEAFSMMNVSKNWGSPYKGEGPIAKSELAVMGLWLVERTREVIEELDPQFFVIENPRAKLRKLELLDDLPRVTVWYCHYGDVRAKPTDLWGKFPPSWRPQPQCHNAQATHSEECCCRDHVAAPRGSKNRGSTSGRRRGHRASVPRRLGISLCRACERDLI